MKQKPYVKPESNNRFFFLYSVKFFSEKKKLNSESIFPELRFRKTAQKLYLLILPHEIILQNGKTFKSCPVLRHSNADIAVAHAVAVPAFRCNMFHH